MRSALWFGFQGSLPQAEARRILTAVYRPDQPVDIGVPDDDRMCWYRSRLLRMGARATEDPVAILAPFTAEGAPVIHVGQEVLVHFLLEKRGYAFESVVLSRGAERLSEDVSVPSAVLAAPKTLYAFQRREYVRVRPHKVTEVVVRWEPGQASQGDPVVSQVSGYIDDLSQGGSRIRVPDFTTTQNDAVRGVSDVRVEFALSLETREVTMALAGSLVRVSSETQPRRLLWIGLKWQEVTDPQRRALAEFILASEREMLRRRREAEA